MFTPSREEFVAAARGGEGGVPRGNLIPVYKELLADSDTPVSAYAALGAGEHSFLLESVVGGATWAAYSFVGVAPRAIVRWQNGTASVTWYDVDAGGPPRSAEWATPDPTAALAEVLGELKPVEIPGLPRFWGGAVGWIAYDCVRAFEELPSRARPGVDLPPLCMVITDTLLIFDNLRQTLKVVATPYVARPERAEAAYESACQRIDAIIAKLREPRRPLPTLTPPRLGEAPGAVPPSSFTKPDFLGAVDRVKEYVLAGDAFQVVLSQRFTEPAAGARPLDVYRALRVINPSPYMFHLEFPEELLSDPKENAEHLMLIDLGRNDVGRVAETGTVHVAEQRVIERYSHVMHMTSHVVGKLAKGKSWLDVLRAAFPAGTLSGAPKIRAMEIIDELEPHQRGIYGGAVGYVSYTGNLDLAIAIRTLVSHGDQIYVQAGAGLVADSVPELEYQETVNKARAVLRAVAMARTAQEPSS
jgi:anthranilate synthase component 1